MAQWVGQIDEFRSCIWEKITNGETVKSAGDSETLVTLQIPFDTFRIFVFYDTCFRTTAPGIGVSQ